MQMWVPFSTATRDPGFTVRVEIRGTANLRGGGTNLVMGADEVFVHLGAAPTARIELRRAGGRRRPRRRRHRRATRRPGCRRRVELLRPDRPAPHRRGDRGTRPTSDRFREPGQHRLVERSADTRHRGRRSDGVASASPSQRRRDDRRVGQGVRLHVPLHVRGLSRRHGDLRPRPDRRPNPTSHRSARLRDLALHQLRPIFGLQQGQGGPHPRQDQLQAHGDPSHGGGLDRVPRRAGEDQHADRPRRPDDRSVRQRPRRPSWWRELRLRSRSLRPDRARWSPRRHQDLARRG